MSQEAMTPQDAHAFLTREIYVPVFLEKLASDFGIVPQNEQEVEHLLGIGSRLSQVREQEQVKQAQAQTSFIAQAANNLDSQMASLGYKGSTNEESLIKNASANLAADPRVAQAVKTFQAALAGELAG